MLHFATCWGRLLFEMNLKTLELFCLFDIWLLTLFDHVWSV
jgi:hypothetical protein